jgi:hypothetical protein
MSPLRWTCKSLRRLAAELDKLGHKISHTGLPDELKSFLRSISEQRLWAQLGGLFRVRKSPSKYGPTMETQPVSRISREAMKGIVLTAVPSLLSRAELPGYTVSENDNKWRRACLLVLNGQTTGRMPRELKPVALCTTSAYVRS